jgi:probable F420-dependent oxidoreductase
MTVSLRFGVALKNFTTAAESPDIDQMIAYAGQAEALGLDSVWVWDHLLLGSRAPFPVFDSLSTLAAIAVSTRRVRLGTGVLVLPLRNPTVLAKVTSTIDRMSKGRLTLGVAAGWYEKEFDAAGVPHAERGRIFMENLRVLYRLWTEAPFNGEEGPYRFRNAVMAPPPWQRPRPEVLIGGYVERVLRRAARHSDGWLNYFYTAASFQRDWARVRQYAEEAGRDPRQLTNVSQLPICVADSYEEADRLVKEFIGTHFDIPAWSDCSPESAVRGTPAQCVEQLAEHVDAGVQHFVFVPLGYSREQLAALAADVIPALREAVGVPS